MKKFAIYFFSFVFICFFLPSLLTKTKEVSSTDKNVKSDEDNNQVQNVEKTNKENIDNTNDVGKFKDIKTIKLLHTDSQEVQEVDLEEYICNVVSAEMPADYELEALKAQAVAARTYTVYRITQTEKKHENADICNESTCCQAWISKEDRFSKWEKADREKYWEKIVNAVNTTQGKMITFEGKPINAFFCC